MAGTLARRHERECPDIASSTDAYARRFAGPVGDYFLSTQLESVLRWIPPVHQCRVLDVGGGHAQLAAPLVERGYDVTVLGSDTSCRDRLDRLIGSDRYTFAEGSLLNFPFSPKSFDVVLAFRLLPHLGAWLQLIDEACRVSAGSVFLDFPERRSVNRLAEPLFGWKRAIEKDTRRFSTFRLPEVAAAFESRGFRVRNTRAQFLLPMALHRLLGSAGLSQGFEAVARALGVTRLFGSPVVVVATEQDSLSGIET